MRSRVALIHPAAFLGTVCRVAPRLVDSVDADGMRRVGFLRGLEATFGENSFNASMERTRFQVLISSGTRLGMEFAQQHAAHAARVDEVEPAEALGNGKNRMQHLLTKQFETYYFQQLDVRIRAWRPPTCSLAELRSLQHEMGHLSPHEGWVP